MGREQQGILAGCGLPDPRRFPAQLLLGPPWPEDPEPNQAASQPDGLTNRRMRARMSGGVGGGGATPSPTRFLRTAQFGSAGLGTVRSAVVISARSVTTARAPAWLRASALPALFP